MIGGPKTRIGRLMERLMTDWRFALAVFLGSIIIAISINNWLAALELNPDARLCILVCF